MTPQELLARARVELEELGPEPDDARERDLWREERRGVVVLLAALGEWDPAVCRRAAVTGAEWVELPPATFSSRQRRNAASPTSPVPFDLGCPSANKGANVNRKQRRIQKRRVRRIGVVVASVAMLGATADLGGAASAGGTPGTVGGPRVDNVTVAVGGDSMFHSHYGDSNPDVAHQDLVILSQGSGSPAITATGHLNANSGNCFVTSNDDAGGLERGRNPLDFDDCMALIFG